MSTLASLRNCEQEPDSASPANRRKITVMSIIETASYSSLSFSNNTRSSRILLGILLLLLFVYPIASAQPALHTTMIVFADQPMPEGLWPALESVLRAELASDSTETESLVNQKTSATSGAANNLQIIRGDQVQPGITVDQSITVYLHGECATNYTPRPDLSSPIPVTGALGWVPIRNGSIDPFIHVSCMRIGQMLGQRGFGRNLSDRNNLMAAGISRVILHEWVHIATQSKHHSKHGLEQAQYSVVDLLAHSAKPHDHPLKAEGTVSISGAVGEAHSLNGGK